MKYCENALEECEITIKEIENVDKDKKLRYSSDPNIATVSFTHEGDRCH